MGQFLQLKSASELREGIFESLKLSSLPLTNDMPECKEPRDAERGEPRPGYNDETDATAVCNAHVDVSEIDEAKLIRKIDWRLLPWLSLLHLLCFLDRTSIGNAKVR